MAVIIQTSFEDYNVAGPPNENLSLIDNGWSASSGIGVVSGGAHTGAKSVLNETGALQWEHGYLGRSITAEAWFNVDSSAPIVSGPNIQIASSLGTPGSSNWPVTAVCDTGTTDLILYLFDVEVARVEDVCVRDTYQKLRVEAKFSTVNEDGDDVNEDGCVKCYLDDVLVINVTGQKVAATSVGWGSDENEYDIIYIQAVGNIDDVLIANDELTCGGVTPGGPPPNDSNPCCGSGPDPTDPNPSTTPNPGNVPVPLQPWTPQCDGGGVVPSAADVVDVEVWTL
jgi:hypothetical protein